MLRMLGITYHTYIMSNKSSGNEMGKISKWDRDTTNSLHEIHEVLERDAVIEIFTLDPEAARRVDVCHAHHTLATLTRVE